MEDYLTDGPVLEYSFHGDVFAERIIKPWNSLPANNDTFKSLAAFKSFVNSVNLTNFVSLGF